MAAIRVKHTGQDFYYLYTKSKLKENLNWYPNKIYSSKQAALKRVEELRKIQPFLIFKIVWNPYPFCKKEDTIVVYEEV